MDAQRFDDLTRALAAGTSRRTALRVLAGGAFGAVAVALGLERAGAKHGCRHHGARCRNDDQCCSGKCSRRGRCKCPKSAPTECGIEACCTADQQCCPGAVACAPGAAECCAADADCEDGNPCTSNYCDVATRTCAHTVTPVYLICGYGACMYTFVACDGDVYHPCDHDLLCRDDSPCRNHYCDPVTEACAYDNVANGTPCGPQGEGRTCQDGVCMPPSG